MVAETMVRAWLAGDGAWLVGGRLAGAWIADAGLAGVGLAGAWLVRAWLAGSRLAAAWLPALPAQPALPGPLVLPCLPCYDWAKLNPKATLLNTITNA